jgi:hypothetical protein
MTEFPSVEAFYRDDERRRFSGELDFGVWWFDARDRCPWRVSWVEQTGDLYAIRLAPAEMISTTEGVVILGGNESGPLRVLAVVEDEEELERRLRGWPDAIGSPGSLEWVVRKVTNG